MKFNWEKVGRKEGQLQIGDILWDFDGKVYLVARHEKSELRILSLSTATSSLKNFEKIAISERIFTL